MSTSKKKMVGAVLVEGGGIAGVQASLDLANSGYKVYLVSRAASIGGMMSHLDKTFPTGDCAICTISPKLVECARNLNIEIHTLSELEKIEGEPGNFKALIKKSPRYIDEKICNDCGECTTACPVEVNDSFNRDLGKRKAIQKYYAQSIPNLPNMIKLGHAPCKVECPANINVQGYIQLIKKKEYIKAVNLIRERNPLAAICGRVCPAPCETACTRSNVDSAVAIRQLKRFASDQEFEMVKSGKLALPEEKTPDADAKKVAVIGSGPSGLTVAQDLADKGIAVTIYESQPKAGGMLRYGIPEYRLPLDILDYEIDLVRRKGVRFVFNTTVGQDITIDKLLEEHSAVFIGIGTQEGTKLGVPGEEAIGVEDGIEFLKKVSMPEERPTLSGHVAVVGGGDVAMDAACNALRLGAEKATILYRRTALEMPAIKEEVIHAKKEGVNFQYLTAPVEFIKNDDGKLTSVRCIKMELGEPDESGRCRPVPVKGSEFEIKADKIIIAIGSKPEELIIKTTPGLPVNKSGNIISDQYGFTGMKGVFSGGDVVTGAATVIEAVGAGKRAAESIVRFLNKEEKTLNRFADSVRPIPKELLPSVKNIEKKPRVESKSIEIKSLVNNYNELEFPISIEDALAEAERCLNCAQCSECMECVSACEKKAVAHNQKDEFIELEVGSVILAPGFDEFDAETKGEYGFNRYKNVMTSVQFERMLSAAGPSGGHIVRRDNGKEAKRIAWIQCVGSRDSKSGNDYCSSICCMATTKQAMIATEHLDDMKGVIFNMDIRAHGKDFDQYYERARAMENLEYIKSIPSRIIQIPQTNDLRLQYLDPQKGLIESDFDLVVLAVGMDPKATVTGSIKKLGIEMNPFGFCQTNRLSPLITSKPGVFVGGAFQEPKDIPETVMQASAAASMSMELLSSAKNTLIKSREYPQEHDVSDEQARIGVFVCHCGINIAGTVDVVKVTESIKDLPGVVYAEHSMYTCSDASLTNIKEQISKNKLNRVVVASCTPRTHEPIFRETLREASLNPYLFELANIRDQCSWVHSNEPEKATEKAIDLVKMSISRARNLSPLEGERIPILQNAVVIGGGVSGMTAALSLAEQGFDVELIEKSGQLGGNLNIINSTLENENLDHFRNGLIEATNSQRNIDSHLNAEVTGIKGHIGHFTVKLMKNNKPKELTCGAIVVATGANQAETKEYQYGKIKNIITQVELENSILKNRIQKSGQTYVMIQCVGSRNTEKPYCSRICCSTAIKNALKIKKQDPDAKIFILYRDIRTYGFRETYYKQAREEGIVFIRFDENKLPMVSDINGVLSSVTVDSPDMKDSIVIEADQLVLSTGIVANDDNVKISNMLKVPLNSNGFYVEAHMKLRPVDFATEGLFLCGLAHSPKMTDENISQAKAAAARAATILSKTHLEVGAQVSIVNQSKCISCMTCVKVCPYGAPNSNYDHKAEIASAKCMGCGICVAECPAKAIQLNHFNSNHFEIMIDQLFNVMEPETVN
jgi:heterodisulfide reductase subunit A-like polyferredoxin